MELITTLTSNQYKLNDNLYLKIVNDLYIYSCNNYLITGENGAGKSSFLYMLYSLLLNKIDNKYLVCYIPQDFYLQFFTIRCFYNGILNYKKDISSIKNTLCFIKDEYIKYHNKLNLNILFLLDEIDQYITPEIFFHNINFTQRTIFYITHNENKILKAKKIGIGSI